MQKSIVELITSEQSAKAVSVVEKTLGKKLLEAIQHQRSEIARQTYGSLGECYGADDTPEFMEPGDNAYQSFYQNALKKFGVSGPQDFKDDNTKQQFFNYLDMNWKAQDAVQQQQVPGMGMGAPAPSGANIDLGTGTQLPAPATQPMPPAANQASQPPMPPQAPQGQPQVCPDPTAHMPAGGANDPSLATMAPAGPSIDKTAPLGADGDDSELDGMQNTQDRSGFDPDMDGDDDSNPQGDRDQDFYGGADGQLGNGDDDDQDPNLEIGDDDDQNGMDLSGDNEGEGDENVPRMNGDGDDDDQDQNGDDSDDDDDEFGDDDAYTVNHNDFLPKDSDEDADGDDDDSDDQDSDDDGDDDQGSGFGKDRDDDSDDDSDDSDDDDEDPDLDIDDDDDDSDDDEKFSPVKKAAHKPSAPPAHKPMPPMGKKKVHEGEDGEIEDGVTFGEEYASDNAEDQAFITERGNFFKMAKKALKGDASIDPNMRSQRLAGINDGAKNHGRAQNVLNKIRMLRDQSSKLLKKQYAEIMGSDKTPEQKMSAKKALSAAHKRTRQHFRDMANAVKGIHTGKLAMAMESVIPMTESIQHTINHSSGRTKVHITANQPEGPFSSRMYVNNGETATLQSAKHKTMKGAETWAHKVMKKHHGE